MHNETSNDWVTIAEAIEHWRGAPSYDRLHRIIKRSGIETRRRGKYLTFRLTDLWAQLNRQQFFQELAKGITGDWYTRSQLPDCFAGLPGRRG